VLSFMTVADWRAGLDVCRRLLEFGGMGHTMVLHGRDDQVIRAMALELPAFRLVVNSPAPHGSVGWTTNLPPSMSLGCGTPGGNITSDNISPMHLVNIKRLAYERRPAVHDHAGSAAAREEGLPRVSVLTPVPATMTAFASGSASSPSWRSSNPGAVIDRAEIARIVDRLLARHQKASAAPAADSCSCGTSPPPADSRQAAPERTDAEPKPASGQQPGSAAKPKTVDFVSEDDVRRAITKGERILVGPRTIITPAARDLGDAREVFAREN
jgi:hypothetical protein